MKIIMKFLFCFFILLLPYIVQAQSVFIESKKYYAVFKDEYRQDTAVFEFPVIVGGVSNDIQHKLDPHLSADSILGDNIDSVISNYRQNGAGLTGCSYRVLYNTNSALSISVHIETLGAYPDSYYEDINLNLSTGKRILISDLIREDAINNLVKRLDDTVQKRIKDKIKEDNISEDDIKWAFGETKFTLESLSHFAIVENGLMFYFDYGLPHVIKALSPDEDILMNYEELKYYFKNDGVKEKVIEKQ